jgi:phage baseplate assembly protein gpV
MTSLNPIFEIWHQAKASQETIAELKNKPIAPYLAVVSNIDDPDGKRKIKVAQPHNPQLETDWLRRLQPHGDIDPPLPEVGSTVLVLSVDGVETNGWYLTCVNDTNPAQDKDDAALDHYESTKGKRLLEVMRDYVLKVAQDFIVSALRSVLVNATEDITFTAGKTIRFSNTIGAYLELNASGFVVLGDAYGHVWTLGGTGGSEWTWNANGSSISIINASDLSINSQSVAVIGATDSHGDQIVTKGY